MKKILCICLSSTIQRTVVFDSFSLTLVNRSEHYNQYASGKAINSARVLQQLEADCVEIVCPVGTKNQQIFMELAKNDHLKIEAVPIPGFTRECWTLLDKTAGTTTEVVVGEPDILPEEKDKIEKAEYKILKIINEKLNHTDAVLLAGSRPGIWSDDLYATIASMVKDAGKIFLADFIGKDLTKTLEIMTPDIIKINDEEFCKTFGLDFPAENEKLKESIAQKSRSLNNMIVVTRGTDSTYAAQNGNFTECPVEKITPLNTTACGDSFNAGFIYEYINSGNFEEALKKGTWCAARNAERECPGDIL